MPPPVPTKMPNLPNLQARILEKLGTTEDTPLTPRESLAVAWIIGRELGPKGYQSELLQQARRDFYEHKHPRFTTLWAWIQTYSLFPQFPTATLAVARYILGDTTRRENIQINWSMAEQLFGPGSPEENTHGRNPNV